MSKLAGVFLMMFSVFLHAHTPYLKEHETGWYWHNDPPVEKKRVASKSAEKAQLPSTKPADPDKTWKLIGKMAERARAAAILNPTPENVANARRIQRLIVNQASVFSERWMLDLLLHPEMDESLVNPSNSAARDIYNQQNDSVREKAIQDIGRSSGLMYFYDGGEAFSERMAEVVSQFATRYRIQVIPVAVNNKFSPLFPRSRADGGLTQQMGVKHIPAVFAIHPVSRKVMPVAYGLISQSELKENILMASKAFQSGENNVS